MKRFFVKFSILLGVIALWVLLFVAFSFFVVKNQHTQSYNASMYDKIERLKSIQKPKIILVGDSNLSFGIHSEMIENEIGMPVVNLGLHAGLGRLFLQEMAKVNINKGDIIVESNIHYENDSVQVKSLWETCEWNRDAWGLIKESDIISIMEAFPWFMVNNLERWLTGAGKEIKDSCYARTSFNEYGDIIYRPQHDSNVYEPEDIVAPNISDEYVKQINEFNRYIIDKGATLLVSAYPIPSVKDYAKSNDIEKFQNELRDKLDCKVISNFNDYIFPFEFFYQMPSHLTSEGADIRTKQLILDLKKYLGGKWNNKA